MGSGNFDATVFKQQAEVATKSKNSGFTAVSMCDEFNPTKVDTRFSKKGPFNEFRDVITVLIGLDVTGSMGGIPKSLLAEKLGSLMVDLKKTFDKPNENLQISFAGIGDAKTDKAPLQVTHFESDNRFALQLQKIWLEGGGGANGAESYNLLWWYAANKTHLNYVKQDERKGILITIGDDNVHPDLTTSEIKTGLDPEYEGGAISNQVLLNAVREQYDVYHIVITDGHAYKHDYLKNADKTEQDKIKEAKQWTDLLGLNNVIPSKSDNVAHAIAEIIKRHRPLEKENMTDLTEKEWEKQNKNNLTDKQWEEVLSYTLCPLTRKFMNHPIEWGGGKRAYEKQAIEDYVREYQRDPITQKKLSLSELILKPNLNIAQLCSNYQSFFDALPEDRKERLVELTFQEIKSESVENKKIEKSSPNLYKFYKNPPENEGKEIKEIEIRSNLECPITQEIMKNPVILVETGQTYEREAIEEWLEKNNTDPLTNKKLKEKLLVPNCLVKSLCDEARTAKTTKQKLNI